MKSGWYRVIRRSTLYGITLVMQVVVLDVAAALIVDFGIAVSALTGVTDIAAASCGVTASGRKQPLAVSHDGLCEPLDLAHCPR